jgi:hypothetical protein
MIFRFFIIAELNWFGMPPPFGWRRHWLLDFFQVHFADRTTARLVVGLVALAFHRTLVGGGLLLAALMVLVFGVVFPASGKEENGGCDTARLEHTFHV